MEEIKCMVQFTPRAEDKFRVSVSPSRLWLESHKTKHQWLADPEMEDPCI